MSSWPIYWILYFRNRHVYYKDMIIYLPSTSTTIISLISPHSFSAVQVYFPLYSIVTCSSVRVLLWISLLLTSDVEGRVIFVSLDQLTDGAVREWTMQAIVTLEFIGIFTDLGMIVTFGGGTVEKYIKRERNVYNRKYFPWTILVKYISMSGSPHHI